MFEKKFHAGWGDMDFNSHMRNTAYLDKASDTRMFFFESNGFPASEFNKLRIGPVVLKDEIEYYKEIGLLEEMRVTLVLCSLSSDGKKFSLKNEFFKMDGRLAARVISYGGWLDLYTRKFVQPPETLLQVLNLLTKTEDFKVG